MKNFYSLFKGITVPIGEVTAANKPASSAGSVILGDLGKIDFLGNTSISSTRGYQIVVTDDSIVWNRDILSNGKVQMFPEVGYENINFLESNRNLSTLTYLPKLSKVLSHSMNVLSMELSDELDVTGYATLSRSDKLVKIYSTAITNDQNTNNTLTVIGLIKGNNTFEITNGSTVINTPTTVNDKLDVIKSMSITGDVTVSGNKHTIQGAVRMGSNLVSNGKITTHNDLKVNNFTKLESQSENDVALEVGGTFKMIDSGTIIIKAKNGENGLQIDTNYKNNIKGGIAAGNISVAGDAYLSISDSVTVTENMISKNLTTSKALETTKGKIEISKNITSAGNLEINSDVNGISNLEVGNVLKITSSSGKTSIMGNTNLSDSTLKQSLKISGTATFNDSFKMSNGATEKTITFNKGDDKSVNINNKFTVETLNSEYTNCISLITGDLAVGSSSEDALETSDLICTDFSILDSGSFVINKDLNITDSLNVKSLTGKTLEVKNGILDNYIYENDSEYRPTISADDLFINCDLYVKRNLKGSSITNDNKIITNNVTAENIEVGNSGTEISVNVKSDLTAQDISADSLIVSSNDSNSNIFKVSSTRETSIDNIHDSNSNTIIKGSLSAGFVNADNLTLLNSKKSIKTNILKTGVMNTGIEFYQTGETGYIHANELTVESDNFNVLGDATLLTNSEVKITGNLSLITNSTTQTYGNIKLIESVDTDSIKDEITADPYPSVNPDIYVPKNDTVGTNYIKNLEFNDSSTINFNEIVVDDLNKATASNPLYSSIPNVAVKNPAVNSLYENDELNDRGNTVTVADSVKVTANMTQLSKWTKDTKLDSLKTENVLALSDNGLDDGYVNYDDGKYNAYIISMDETENSQDNYFGLAFMGSSTSQPYEFIEGDTEGLSIDVNDPEKTIIYIKDEFIENSLDPIAYISSFTPEITYSEDGFTVTNFSKLLRNTGTTPSDWSVGVLMYHKSYNYSKTYYDDSIEPVKRHFRTTWDKWCIPRSDSSSDTVVYKEYPNMHPLHSNRAAISISDKNGIVSNTDALHMKYSNGHDSYYGQDNAYIGIRLRYNLNKENIRSKYSSTMYKMDPFSGTYTPVPTATLMSIRP